jgi:hypothetical protein
MWTLSLEVVQDLGQVRWDRIGELFDAAMECKLAEGAAFLHEACAGDEALRRAVEALVAQRRDADSFMEPPALEAAAKALAELQAHEQMH